MRWEREGGSPSPWWSRRTPWESYGVRGSPPWWSGGGARAGSDLPDLTDADLAYVAACFVEEREAPVGGEWHLCAIVEMEIDGENREWVDLGARVSIRFIY